MKPEKSRKHYSKRSNIFPANYAFTLLKWASEPAFAKSDEHSAPDWRPGFEAKRHHVCQRHLMHVKSVMEAMFSKFPSKLYLWGYQSWGAIPRRIKIVMACLRIIVSDESQTIGNSPLLSYGLMITQPTNLKIGIVLNIPKTCSGSNINYGVYCNLILLKGCVMDFCFICNLYVESSFIIIAKFECSRGGTPFVAFCFDIKYWSYVSLTYNFWRTILGKFTAV